MDSSQNTTPDTGGASTPDPIDRIEAFLAAEDGDTTGQPDDTPDDPQPAAKTTDDPKDGVPAKDGEPLTTAQLEAILGLEEGSVDIDEEGQPVFKTKIGGKEGKAKFQDFVKDYQLRGHAENVAHEAAKAQQAAERKLQEAEQVIQQRHAQVDQSLQHVQQLAAVAQDELMREYNSIPWNELRQADPGRAALLEVEFQKRAGRIQGVMGDINNRRAQAMQAAKQQQEKAEQERTQSEARRLLELIPEWKDRELANKEYRELTGWMEANGYGDVDMMRSSQVMLARNAWKHATLEKSRPQVENKVRTAPKLVKPGQSTQPGDKSDEPQLRNLKQQARMTGGNSVKATAAWLLAKGLA